MKLKFLILLTGSLAAAKVTNAQQKLNSNDLARPKLVVGLVVDQMRWDYLYRFYNRYSNGGFKRLINKGYSFDNTMIPYMPTYTAPGHTSIYTGAVPATNGIVGNNWYEKSLGKSLYCTEDSTAQGVGNNDAAGKMSPNNLWATTITDELRLSNQKQSKVIGIALKDRGAILPAGHAANAAYWYDDKTGKWITSNFYMTALPNWVNNFNALDEPGTMMQKDWNTLYPINTYTLSAADNQPYEGNIPGLKSPTFPQALSTITTGKYSSFKYTPYAATYTFDFAKAALKNENLGKGNVTDFLTISISSTDYMGHTFGPNSIEAEDTYLRLDKDIEQFLQYLDAQVGNGNYVVFLSADHGAAHVPGYLTENNIPAGIFSDFKFEQELNKILEDSFGIKRAIASVQNYQVYFNEKAITQNGKSVTDVQNAAINYLQTKPFITQAFKTAQIGTVTLPEPIKTMLLNGFTPQRSGEVMFLVKPGYFDGGNKGTTHGLWNPYDAHIPLIFYGWNIKQGKTNRPTYMTDIAPTIAALLHIQMPSACVGKPLIEITQ
ncbi:alkaline phosphatase PafA [Ferruginibacter yonginensis]|uniref:Alkaline phosphatase PafA n=1 Tax=Ferruginibacter yonginensis TaxID=1310416 RepID=A0ABV8QPA5_9BACT